MNRKAHHPPSPQNSLPLNGEVHWTQLPRDVRERCRALVVKLLTRLAQRPATGGDENER